MKKATLTIFLLATLFVLAFGAPSPITVNEVPASDQIFDEELKHSFEKEQEQPEEEIELATECQECLISAEQEKCIDIHPSCLELPDCSNWLACVGWCDAYEADDDCYSKCNDNFVDVAEVEIDLRNCACEFCGSKCRILCGVEGY